MATMKEIMAMILMAFLLEIISMMTMIMMVEFDGGNFDANLVDLSL